MRSAAPKTRGDAARHRGAGGFDWNGDRRPRHGHDTVVCELHVRGVTRRANSGVAAERRGTFAGLIDKIPDLRDLGVAVVELMPVFRARRWRRHPADARLAGSDGLFPDTREDAHHAFPAPSATAPPTSCRPRRRPLSATAAPVRRRWRRRAR
ncbi:hypothetical protein [Azospirillum sp. ST 5-10]|uniref:hypothetical protein n=1 Tax=unclassified Azospirillum TaxID=2630922 RepID=UPI003F4A40C0